MDRIRAGSQSSLQREGEQLGAVWCLLWGMAGNHSTNAREFLSCLSVRWGAFVQAVSWYPFKYSDTYCHCPPFVFAWPGSNQAMCLYCKRNHLCSLTCSCIYPPNPIAPSTCIVLSLLKGTWSSPGLSSKQLFIYVLSQMLVSSLNSIS